MAKLLSTSTALAQILLLGLACALATGCGAAQIPPPSTGPRPEIPLDVSDKNERLRLMLEAMSRPAATSNSTPATAAIAEPSASLPPGPQYTLKPGDIIELKVFQEDDLNAKARVAQDGAALLPLLGAVHVGGLSVEQARQQVQRLLAQDYLVNPQVLLTVSEFAKRRFSVMGQVQQPGFYNISENEKVNLLQAISMAGGYTPFANPGRIIIKRTVNGRETVLRMDGRAMARDKNKRIEEVQPEDTIYVGERGF